MAHIRFANVELEYPIRENQHASFKEFVLHTLLRRKKAEKVRVVRALDDLSFEVNEGERLGIIGLNGAGKSTLLRTIAGVYPINKGTREVDGTISSLFDIALGFEQDASGRSNIFFRSYLQGESPKEVRERIKDIEDFTELGEFLDLPIRCYSTGMVMRLAFAIATSRHPEILLVDEVFATGDLLFRQKAEARMRDLMTRARIVVLVGHNLDFLSEFCTRILWLDKGRLYAEGPTAEIIGRYQAEVAQIRFERKKRRAEAAAAKEAAEREAAEREAAEREARENGEEGRKAA